MKHLNILLVDDETEHCQLYIDYIRSSSCPHLLYVSNGCSDAIDKVNSYEPDVIILDLEFHHSDGDGILFMETLQTLELQKLPYIVIITKNNSKITHEEIRKYADYVIPKYKPDYSPKLVFDIIFNILGTKIENSIAPKLKSVEQEIRSMIECAGIIKNTDGKTYLIDAIAIVIRARNNNIVLSHDVYPQIAAKYGVSTDSVEKSIKYAIQKAWNETDMDILAKNFSGVSNVMMTAPQNKEVIFNFADMYKRENIG